MKKLFFYFMIPLTFLFSCGDGTFEHKKEQVLAHFKNDTLKQQAANFLIENAKGLKSIDSLSLKKNKPFFEYLEELARISELDEDGRLKTGKRKPDEYIYRKGLDSIIKQQIVSGKMQLPNYIEDSSSISSKAIIENIDNAFWAWKNFPWSRDVSFETFKEYILPYRVIDTYSLESRAIFLDQYKNLLPKQMDISKAADSIREDIHLWFKEDGTLSSLYPFLFPMTFSEIYKSRIGTCYEATALRISIMRSVGIPAAFEIIPHWGNVNTNHFFYRVIDGSNNHRPLIDNKNIYRDTRDIIPGSSYTEKLVNPPKDYQIIYNKTVPKVFRKGFAINKNSLKYLLGSKEVLPAFFDDDRLTDVTSDYLETATVNVNLLDTLSSKSTVLYLAVFDPTGWQPVDWTIINGKTAKFTQVGKNIMYLPCYYTKSGVLAAGEPFLLNNDGNLNFFSGASKTQTLELERKFRLSSHNIGNALESVGIRIQGANKSDLSDTVNLYKIDNMTTKITEAHVKHKKKFRYIICNFGGLKKATLAELELWGTANGKGLLLKGKTSGNQGIYKKSISEIFDKDRNTYYENDPKGPSYFMVDFGRNNKNSLDKIRFCPRNDTNDILPGDLYELFYWDGRWVTLGKQKGKDFSPLVFTGQKNVLYWLRNLSRGKEERIFTYENGKQCFW